MTLDRNDGIKFLAASIAREQHLDRFNRLAFALFLLLNRHASERDDAPEESSNKTVIHLVRRA